MAKKQRNYKGPKANANRRALARGVVPVRRIVSAESHEVFEDLIHELKCDLHGAGRAYRTDTLSVTVVGLARFDSRLKSQGPKTKDIIKQVPSCSEQLVAKVGKLGIYGSMKNPKLAVELHSPDLIDEFDAIAEAYRKRRFPLRVDPNVDPGRLYVPHCTVGNLYNDQAVAYFEDQRTLEHYNFGAVAIGETISLQPIKLIGE